VHKRACLRCSRRSSSAGLPAGGHPDHDKIRGACAPHQGKISALACRPWSCCSPGRACLPANTLTLGGGMRAFISVTKCCRISTGRFWNEVLPDFCAASVTKCCRIFSRRVLHLFAAQPSFWQRSAAGFSETDRATQLNGRTGERANERTGERANGCRIIVESFPGRLQ
jgi:hypothetical protein